MPLSRLPQTGALAFLIVSGLSVSLAHAQSSEDGGGRGGPPSAALEACVDKAEGAACSFTGRRGDVEGMCIVIPRGEEQLACAPEGGRPDRNRNSDRPER